MIPYKIADETLKKNKNNKQVVYRSSKYLFLYETTKTRL